MAKRIEMTPENQKLYNDLQKLVKKANQRILRLEKATGEKGTFAVKELYDYLGVNQLQAITKGGRVRLSKAYNIQQLEAIKKAVEKFTKEGAASTSRNIKKLQKEYSKLAGKPLSLSHLNTLYQSGKHYTWIYDYLTPSEFWAFVQTAKENRWDVVTFSEQLALLIEKEIDEELQRDLEALYIYVMG